MATETHIVPVMVGDPDLCKQASDLLLDRHGIYIQPINYPTVPHGAERLRITPTPAHNVRLIRQLVEAMVSVWHELDLPLGGGRPQQVLQRRPFSERGARKPFQRINSGVEIRQLDHEERF
jgi:5-aminolevulinate synthase